MNGLIKKDLITLKKQQKLSLIGGILSPVIVLLITLQGTGALLLGALVLPFLTVFIPFIFVGSDSLCKWDKYAISLPISKKQIVASRYLSCCLISAVFFLFSLVLNIGAYIWFQDHSISLHLAAAFIGLGVSLFSVFFLLPTSYIKGHEGSGLVIIIIMSIIMSGYAFFKIRRTNFDIFSLSLTPTLIVLLIGISVAILIGFSHLSYIVSVAIYRKEHS